MLGTEDAFKRWKFKVIILTYSRFKYAFAEKLLTWISKKEFVQPRIHPYAPNTIKLELIFLDKNTYTPLVTQTVIKQENGRR